MTAYHSNGERSKSPSGQQERVTEGDKDESPRVTRTNHRGWQGRVIGEDKNGASGRTKNPLERQKTSSWQSFRKRLLYLHAQAKAFTRTSWGLYLEKLRPLPVPPKAFARNGDDLSVKREALHPRPWRYGNRRHPLPIRRYGKRHRLFVFRKDSTCHIKDYQRKYMKSSPYRRVSQIFYLNLLRVSTKKQTTF